MRVYDTLWSAIDRRRHPTPKMSADDGATAVIPLEMKRLVVTSPGNGGSVADCTVEVQTVPTPTLKPGEVLIKVVAAPVNPSDYGGWYKSSPSSSSYDVSDSS